MASPSANIIRKPVLLVIGAGAGIGTNVARRFVEGGYHACLCRRSNQQALDQAVGDLHGQASGYLLDATKADSIESLVETVEQNIGPIDVAVYNLGAQIGNRSLEDTSLKQFEMGWKLGTFGLFRLAKALLPKMAAREQRGTLLVTSSTAAVRGNVGQHSHTAAMSGRRMLCQSLNHEFGPKGVHISHIVIDGAVDSPDTLGKMVGEEMMVKWRPRLMKPQAIADTYWHLAHQDPSVRTFELDLRGQQDTPWWNSDSKL